MGSGYIVYQIAKCCFPIEWKLKLHKKKKKEKEEVDEYNKKGNEWKEIIFLIDPVKRLIIVGYVGMNDSPSPM